MATFIDLFAGLGGFHKALKDLGHSCVFASEIDSELRDLYEQNWRLQPHGDLREILRDNQDSIPKHDILCAGFPCQPFSKAGKRLGREDADHGTLFDEIIKVLRVREPRYFILENVPHLAKHDNEQTWDYMRAQLTALGYEVDHRNYSPHEFGIPQHRIRIFIVGSRTGLKHFDFAKVDQKRQELRPLAEFLNGNGSKPHRQIPEENLKVIKVWQEFLDALPNTTHLPGHPIWAMEFGATYPFDAVPPSRLNSSELGRYKGVFGAPLKGLRKSEQMALLPSYAQVSRKFPNWKQRFIRLSRQFYVDNQDHIREVVAKIRDLDFQSWQKLEWNVGAAERTLSKYILQFRASGLRVKNPDFFPSLVCTTTQVPIVGWENRYLTKEEGLALHALQGISLPNGGETAASRALGNAVNAAIVTAIAEELLIFEGIGNQDGDP